MNWYIESVISAFANSGNLLCWKKLQQTYPSEVFLFYIFLFLSIVLGIINFPVNIKFTAPMVFLIFVAAFSSWLGNYSYSRAILTQPNLGYIETIANIRLALTYFFSIYFWNNNIDLVRLAGLVGISIAIFLVTYSPGGESQGGQGAWWWWAFLAGVMYAVLAVANKFLFIQGVKPQVALSAWALVTSLLYGGLSLKNRKSLVINNQKGLILLAVILSIIANVTLLSAYNTAPNLAYPTAISGSRSLLLFLIAVVFKMDKMNLRRFIGVLLAFGSAILLA